MFVVITPSIGAALITVSRIMDARHHPFDVISGSLLGILCAFTAYRQYFPSLSEPWKKGRAFPIRSWGTIGGPGTAHVEREISRDEGVEPLRTGPIPLHLQSTRGINVFREQVARTDGHRHPQDPSFARHDGADSMPYSAPGVLRSRGGRRPDEFWDELSEDEHRDVELQAPAYGGDRRIAGPPETAPQSTAQPLHIAPAAPIVEPRFTT